MTTSTLTLDRLKEALRYDLHSGQWTWLRTLSARSTAGSPAGGVKPSGYELIGIDGVRYRSHRLAWFYMTGAWPSEHIDHIDGNRSNNRWFNLRQATNLQNSWNRGANKNNRSGFKGVFWNKQAGRWQARINYGGKQHHLGSFDDAEQAHAAYQHAAAGKFGKFSTRAVVRPATVRALGFHGLVPVSVH